MNNKISKKGLWYKVHKKCVTDQYRELVMGYPVNICPWFWKGLFCGLGLLLKGLGILLAVILASAVFTTGVFILASFFNAITLAHFTGYYFGDPLGGFVLFSVATIVILIGAIKENWPWFPTYISKYFKSKPAEPKPEKQPNVLSQYLKAKKGKFCYNLELEDD